jgi:predicted chitinase
MAVAVQGGNSGGGSSPDLVKKLVDATRTNNTSANDRFSETQLKTAAIHIKAILDECAKHGVTDKGQIAYILGTVRRESNMGNSMLEKIDDATANKKYSKAALPSLGNGDEASGDGAKFKGRGYVQITGRGNYTKWSQKLGIDLIGNPDKACEPNVAAEICVVGMKEGLFAPAAGPLSKYIGGGKNDFLNARAIVNGGELKKYPDKAKLIVGYAESYYKALTT